MKRWAIRLPRASLTALGALRLLPGIRACAIDDEIWLRGESLREEDELRLRQVPGARRYFVTTENELIPHGARLPVDRLPEERWTPLREFLVPQVTLAPLPAFAPPPQGLVLARDHRERPIAALLTSLAAFAAYAETAPSVRLSRLEFVASREQQAFIVGALLPPLEGLRYWEANGLFVAAGYCWQPSIDALLVRQILGLAEDDMVIWHTSGQWDRISRANFVAARRAAVRATRDGLALGTNGMPNV